MADQTEIVKYLATEIVEQASALMNALEEFENATDWRTDANIAFTDYEDLIAGTANLCHAEGAHYNKISGVIVPDLIAYLEATTISGGPLNGENYKEVLQQVRREL
jgi:hypothetical protein